MKDERHGRLESIHHGPYSRTVIRAPSGMATPWAGRPGRGPAADGGGWSRRPPSLYAESPWDLLEEWRESRTT